MLFVDFTSAFNTIIPDILINKLLHLGLSTPICTWIRDFLTNRSQVVRLGPHLSSTIKLSIGAPQGCVLSPLLYSLYTSDCSPVYPTNNIIKFADDITVIGQIVRGDETHYRAEIERLTEWCHNNNLKLNTLKTKELILDFRRKRQMDPPPLLIAGATVERVNTFKYLGVHINNDLSWSVNTTTIIKRAQQRLYFLRLLKRNNLSESLLVGFYRSAIESTLTYCITVWYTSCTVALKKSLQRVIRSAEKIIGCSLPTLDSIASSRYLSRAKNIINDPTHPGHEHFQLLPSGRRYRSVRTRTSRFRDSFFPTAIITLNTHLLK